MFNWKEFKDKYIWKNHIKKASYTEEEAFGLGSEDALLQDKLIDLKYFFIHLWEWPGDRWFDLKMYHQRGMKGWSVSDAWGFHYYQSRVTLEGLEWLKKHKHGCPFLDGYNNFDHSDEDFEKMCKEWDGILDTMIYTFKVIQEADDHDLIIPYGEDYFTDEELKRHLDFCEKVNKPHKILGRDVVLNSRVITREEFEKYSLGWKYYRRYYFSLWD